MGTVQREQVCHCYNASTTPLSPFFLPPGIVVCDAVRHASIDTVPVQYSIIVSSRVHRAVVD